MDIRACSEAYMHVQFSSCFIKKKFFCGSGKKRENVPYKLFEEKIPTPPCISEN